MRHALNVRAWMMLPLAVALTGGARAQNMFEVQETVGDVLSARRDATFREGVLRRRRAEAQAQAVEQRIRRQDLALQEQASELQALRGELQALRDERQLTAQAEAFDAAVAARDWSLARSYVAPVVTVDLPGGMEPGPRTITVDALIAGWAASSARSAVAVRARTAPRVRIQGDTAVLTSTGYASDLPGAPARPSSRQAGDYEHRFTRSAEGWKIDALSFRAGTNGY